MSMFAAWYCRNGAARDVLELGRLPKPQPRANEVLVRLYASGVNPSDIKARRGRPLGNMPRIVPHSDGAGMIEAVGEGVAPARIGQRVWVWNGQWQRPLGTAAEYIALPAVQAVELPDRVSFAEGACLGIPMQTAFHALRMAGELSGKTLLVTGAASSVGNYVTQIASRHFGARVIGTVGSLEKATHALAAGADHVIDYKKEDVAAQIMELTRGYGVDAIIDMDFSSTAQWLGSEALAPHGEVICYGSNNMEQVPIPFRPVLFRSLSLRFFLVYELRPEERRAALRGIGELLRDAQFEHAIGARFPLEEIVQAHEAVEAGRLIGKVVLDIA